MKLKSLNDYFLESFGTIKKKDCWIELWEPETWTILTVANERYIERYEEDPDEWFWKPEAFVDEPGSVRAERARKLFKEQFFEYGSSLLDKISKDYSWQGARIPVPYKGEPSEQKK